MGVCYNRGVCIMVVVWYWWCCYNRVCGVWCCMMCVVCVLHGCFAGYKRFDLCLVGVIHCVWLGPNNMGVLFAMWLFGVGLCMLI